MSEPAPEPAPEPAQVLPPHPAPHRPAAAVPAGAIDCHVHVFAPPDRYPFMTGRAYTPAPGLDPARLARMHATLGVSRAVLVASNVYGEDLRATEDALSAEPSRFRGVALLRPEVTDDELKRLDMLGFRAARINLVAAGALRLEHLAELAPRLAARRWHIEVQPTPAALAEIGERLHDLPVEVVVDHLGLIKPEHGLDHPGTKALLRLLDRGRTWIKLSAPYVGEPGGPRFPKAVDLARRFVAAAPDHCLWGSNWPHPQAMPIPDDGDLMDWLAEVAPDEAGRRRILVENPARRYGFPPA